MATIVLSAAGMALGSSLGGSVLGLSTAVIGRAAGAAVGRVIDQRLLGNGSEPVEAGRVDRFRLTGASEGAAIQRVFGRMRVAGQVIWATQFKETEETTGGGKGAGPSPKVTEFSYSISLAIALCEGEITRVGRIWADGTEIRPDDLNMRVYTGSQDQLADPKIVAVQGAAETPAYRGTAYVVLEDLELSQFGNRVPQFTFEVMRPAAKDAAPEHEDLAHLLRAVALIPGTGEYALATTPAYLEHDAGETVAINVNAPSGETDFIAATTALKEELPQVSSALLVVSWFGDDLRCNHCKVQPKVEQTASDATDMPWRAGGIVRAQAAEIARSDDRPIYGGTPADAAVIEAITQLKANGQSPVFYPFILMEQQVNNGLVDPYRGVAGQPALPWRGRITTSLAPGQPGTVDGSGAAVAEVAAFMGNAAVSDFAVSDGVVTYSGPSEWRYRRFILHYAHLCAAAGGISAFCIGSEMRGLTQIRGPNGSFPAVDALIQLAADVRSILGPETKISYAADWSEYHGYQPAGTADKLFHLDALWADPNIDFIGIDNYMPLSDWRDDEDHADTDAGAIYDLDYLMSNVAGGEGYDWFYHSDTARDAQIRTPITDGDGEPWVWRYKDLKGWWSHRHHNRIGGIRAAAPTAWVPQSKPIWFTELGCAAIDKGTNQPNKFIDPKSSESRLPHYSNGMRDDFIQMQYLRAMHRHFGQPENNPVSEFYRSPMVAMDKAHVWAWDCRPFPYFPGNDTLWSDGANYARGHWLNGRASNRTLASVVAEICAASGVTSVDTSRLFGVLRGYHVTEFGAARAALQPLLMAYGIEVSERDGKLIFANRDGRLKRVFHVDSLAQDPAQESATTLTRAPAVEETSRVQAEFIDTDGSYEAMVAETVHPGETSQTIARSTLPLALTRSEGDRMVNRWITEARVARDTISFALPASSAGVGAGDTVDLQGTQAVGRWRIDNVEDGGLRLVEATRIAPETYAAQPTPEVPPRLTPYVAPAPVDLMFLDLPLLAGDEVPYAPYMAVSARPWPGVVAVMSSSQDSGYGLDTIVTRAADTGVTETVLPRGVTGRWDRRTLDIKLYRGDLSAVGDASVLAGNNTLAVGDGSPDKWEILQATEAEPLGDGRYRLSRLLRGQLGSQGITPVSWPAGARVVLLNGKPDQLDLKISQRGTDRYFLFGPAKLRLTHNSFRRTVHQFQGNGLRPYPVAHLRAQGEGDVALSWIRQTRISGDSWDGVDVPLGEDSEQYHLVVTAGGEVVRTALLTAPTFTYTAAARQADAGTADVVISVAQVSAIYGVGPAQSVVVAGG